MEEGEVAVLVAGPGHITINTLPDEVLLAIFDFCVNLHSLDPYILIWKKKWRTLVQVCRRWRSIEFASPHRLDLQLFCTPETSMKDMLDIWPALLISLGMNDLHHLNEDNVISILKYNDRICKIRVDGFQEKDSFERMLASMQIPFPRLTDLLLAAAFPTRSPTAPDSFLGGSAPGLRSLYLNRIAVPGLPNLLLSSTCLIRLTLEYIPRSGYISPYVMADCLSSLVRLEKLRIAFPFHPHPYETSPHPPPLTRSTLPKLIHLFFQGTSEYLEILFTWIDAPLDEFMLINFSDPVSFDILQKSRFIGREESIIEEFNQARMRFEHNLIEFTLLSRKGVTGGTSLRLSVEYGDLAWQLRSLYRSRPVPPCLDLSDDCYDITEFASGRSPPWPQDMVEARWLEFLHSSFFAAVENLYLSKRLVLCIAPILRDFASKEDGGAKALPALKSLFLGNPPLKGPLLEIIRKFIVARESAGHPVTMERKE